MSKPNKAEAASSAAPRERLVWRVRKGARIPAEGGPEMLPGEVMSEDDPRFQRWQSSLCSTWEPVAAPKAVEPARYTAPSKAVNGEDHED